MKPNTPIETACFRQVSISDARLLRDKVLRPGYAPGGSVYPGDDEPETLHIGAFMRNNVVAVATICHENMPGKSETAAWRLRGMATLPQYRGLGLAKRLVNDCMQHAIDHGGVMVWCSSRIATVRFYESLSFEQFGKYFRLPQFSDELYVLMWRHCAS
jgi:GNAT superfamily N-acetyltransferase